MILILGKVNLNVNCAYFPFRVTLSDLANQPLLEPSWFLSLAILLLRYIYLDSCGN